MINLSFRRFADFVIFDLLFLQSLSYSINGSTTTMHVTCGTDAELTCPIRSVDKSDEVISWFRPNSSHHRLSFITIGDILLPEYAELGRFNLISSPSSNSRLLINNISTDDQGYYKCKSSTRGQHNIKLIVNSHPHLSPSSPILLYPVNRTFSITCSLPCDRSVELNNFIWLVNGQPLHEDRHKSHRETILPNAQRLTVFLSRKSSHFTEANYTCQYKGQESSVLVRRRTKEELHRLPRQEGSSSAYFLQAALNTGQRQSGSWSTSLLLLFLLWRRIRSCNMVY